MAPLYPLIGVLRCCAITCFSCLTETGRGWRLRSKRTSESEYCSMLGEKWGRPKKHGEVHMVCCSPLQLPLRHMHRLLYPGRQQSSGP